MADTSDKTGDALNQTDQRRLEEYKEMVAKNIRSHSDDWDGVNLKAMPLSMLVAIKRDEAKSDGHSLDHGRSIDGVTTAGGPDGKGGVVVYQNQSQDLCNTMLINRYDLNRSEAENIQSVHELNMTLRQQEQQERVQQQQVQQDQRQQSEQRDSITMGTR